LPAAFFIYLAYGLVRFFWDNKAKKSPPETPSPNAP